LKKYLSFAKDMAIGGEKAEIDFKQQGYLFLAKDENIDQLKRQMELQQSYGVPSEFLEQEVLLSIIPELNNEDLQGGLYCAEDGYLDSYSVMQGYARKAKEMGANYVYKAVDVVTTAIGKVTGAQCENGEKYEAPTVINCAGAWAPEL